MSVNIQFENLDDKSKLAIKSIAEALKTQTVPTVGMPNYKHLLSVINPTKQWNFDYTDDMIRLINEYMELNQIYYRLHQHDCYFCCISNETNFHLTLIAYDGKNGVITEDGKVHVDIVEFYKDGRTMLKFIKLFNTNNWLNYSEYLKCEQEFLDNGKILP